MLALAEASDTPIKPEDYLVVEGYRVVRCALKGVPSTMTGGRAAELSSTSCRHGLCPCCAQQVKPYHYDFCCNVRQRWLGRSIVDIFSKVGTQWRLVAVGRAACSVAPMLLLTLRRVLACCTRTLPTGVSSSRPTTLCAGPGRWAVAGGRMRGQSSCALAASLKLMALPHCCAAAPVDPLHLNALHTSGDC
jgi:hypothetical protein